MHFTRVHFVCALVAIAAARPQPGSSGSKRAGKEVANKHELEKRDVEEGSDDQATTFTSGMKMNSEDLSGHLRCASCLIDCTNVKNSLSYYLCQECIELCFNHTHAFMHFFSSHKCELIIKSEEESSETPRPGLTPPLWDSYPTSFPQVIPEEEQRLGLNSDASSTQQQSLAPGDNYLDRYMQHWFFSADDSEDECSTTKKNYADIKNRLDQCVTSMKRCNSELQESQQSGYEYSLSPYPDYDYPQYNNPIEYPDRERLYMTNSSEDTAASDADATDDHETNSTREELSHSQEESMQIINRYKSMFVNQKDFEILGRQSWGKDKMKIVNMKSIQRTDHKEEEEKRKRAVCPTKYSAQAPRKADHKSGAFSVQVLQDEDWKQPFIFAHCTERPTMHALAHAECVTMQVQRLALVIVGSNQKHLFNNCEPFGSTGRYACRDWINIPGACSLYMSPDPTVLKLSDE